MDAKSKGNLADQGWGYLLTYYLLCFTWLSEVSARVNLLLDLY